MAFEDIQVGTPNLADFPRPGLWGQRPKESRTCPVRKASRRRKTGSDRQDAQDVGSRKNSFLALSVLGRVDRRAASPREGPTLSPGSRETAGEGSSPRHPRLRGPRRRFCGVRLPAGRRRRAGSRSLPQRPRPKPTPWRSLACTLQRAKCAGGGGGPSPPSLPGSGSVSEAAPSPQGRPGWAGTRRGAGEGGRGTRRSGPGR